MNHREILAQLTSAEVILLLEAKVRGGEILDDPDQAPDCGTLVTRGLVGKYEVALTQAGHAFADWLNETYPFALALEKFRSGLRYNP